MITVLFPYATLFDSEPALSVASVRLDGAARPKLVKKEDATVPLYDEPGRWRDLEVGTPRGRPRKVRAGTADAGGRRVAGEPWGGRILRAGRGGCGRHREGKRIAPAVRPELPRGGMT